MRGRLCEHCERQRTKYTLVGVEIAVQIYRLGTADLAELWSTQVAPGSARGPRRFLRSDVEKLSARVHGDGGDGAVVAGRAAAARDWKAGGFAPDPRDPGKTKKWKPRNTATYHQCQRNIKDTRTFTVDDQASMDLSGLVYSGFGD